MCSYVSFSHKLIPLSALAHKVTFIWLAPLPANWVSISSVNGLSPVRRQAITWTNAGFLSIAFMGANFNEIWIGILSFPLEKYIWSCHLSKWWPFWPEEDDINAKSTSTKTQWNTKPPTPGKNSLASPTVRCLRAAIWCLITRDGPYGL